MLRNYFAVALRSLGKQKLYSTINVVGLALGLAFAVLIGLHVHDEVTFDRGHARADRIVRVTAQRFAPNGTVETEHPWQPAPLAAAMEASVPEVEHAVRLFEQSAFVRRDELTVEAPILFADPAVFEVFSFPLQRGDARTALTDLNSVVLSPEAATRYFGDSDPLGQTLDIRLGDAYRAITVTGVAAPVPANSSVRFDLLMPFAVLPDAYGWIASRMDQWNRSSFFVYALLREGASADAARTKMAALYTAQFPDEAAEMRAEGTWTSAHAPFGYGLQPLTNIHLNPTVGAGLTPPSDPLYSYILGGLALAILLLASINFTMLAIGRSAARAREIGVRKVVGARRGQLLAQFWGEALLMSVLALAVGLALAALFLPTFNALAGKSLSFDAVDGVSAMVALVGLTLFVGLLAGSYPALVLSGLKPLAMLQQRLRLGGANALTRTLVVVQFAVSVVLIVGTLVMLRQLDYVQSRSLGYNQEHLVVVPMNGLDGPTVLARFRTALAGDAAIRGVTGMSSAFTHGYSREGWNDGEKDRSAYVYRVEADFLDVMEASLVAGRAFDPARSTDSTGAVLVNEAFVREAGWTDPLSQTLAGFYAEPEVVGVVRDLNFLPLHEAVEPMVLTLDPGWGLDYVLVRIAPDAVPATLDRLRATWAEIAPALPFQYSFLDDDLAAQYESEARWSQIVGYGALFAVFIACLGLFGLASLAVAGRTKEVGVRKVLGASVLDIVSLLTRGFAAMVVVAVGIAAPVAYLAAQHWLEGFAYRIDLGPGVFLLAGGLALLVALATVSTHAFRAANADPVQSLRAE